MKFKKTAIALAAFALCAAAPFAAQAAPSVSFTSPQAGATLAKNQGNMCTVSGSSISRVVFTMTNSSGRTWSLNTDTSSPFNCWITSNHYLDGNYTIRAVAYDASGANAATTRNVVINNNGAVSGGGGGGTINPAPQVSFVKPATGTSVAAGQTVACEVSASDTDGIQQVQWYLDGVLKSTETSAPYNFCNVGALSAGARVIRAVATDSRGATGEAQVSVNVGSTSGGGGGGGGTLPTAQFATPASGGVLKGDANGIIQGPPNCTLTGTNIARAQFYLGNVLLNTDGNAANGFGCWLNTNHYQPGPHTLKAVAYNAAGQSVTVTQPVVIEGAASNPAPVVTINKPAAGASLSGDVTAANCEAVATDNGSITGVQFSLTSSSSGTKTLLQNDASSPYQCSFDSRSLPNGNYVLAAEATDNQGAKTTQTRAVAISNLATENPGGGTGAISSGDIVGKASADMAFSQQNGYNMQAYGDHISAPVIPETGKHGTVLPNGETLRFGKVFDPAGGAAKALQFQVHSSDPNTSGAKRTELRFMNTIQWDTVYWIAFSAYVYDWGTAPNGDEALFGTQLHTGNDSLNLSPSFSLYTLGAGDRQFKVSARWSTSCSSSGCGTQSSVNSPNMDIPFGRWVDFVFKFKQNTTGSGFVQVWMDGTQIFNHQGNLGFNVGVNDYMKFGYYNWTGAQGNARKVLLRAPHIVSDPTGSKYNQDQVRALVGSAGAGSSAGGSGGGGSSGVCSTITCAAQ